MADEGLNAARLEGPLFEHVRPLLARLAAGRWPTHAELSALAEGVVTSRGMPVRVVAPRGPGIDEKRHYEIRVAQTGEVETRPQSWHDLFNALQWVLFPRAKSGINAQHAAMLEEGGEREARSRSPERDALTLFDEGGVIVAASSPEVFRAIAAFEWKRLFWERRDELARTARFIPFGHALLEQAMNPYIGMIAKTVFVPVSDFFFMLAPESQREEADRLLAAHFADRKRFASPKAMAPMPVLGVPGWHPRTASEDFYDLASYFRSKPRGSPPPP